MALVVLYKWYLDSVFQRYNISSFMNISRTEWQTESLRNDRANARFDQVIFFLNLTTTCVGFVGSLMTVLVMNLADYRNQQSFKCYMLVISSCDLVYTACNLCFVVQSRYNLWKTEGTAMLLYIMETGNALANYSSICSDLCNLCLTFERFVALWKPVFWRNRTRRWKKTLTWSALVCSFTFGVIRFHDSARRKIVARTRDNQTTLYKLLYHEFSKSPAFYVWEQFSLLVLPVAVLLLMTSLSAMIIVLMRRRRRKVGFSMVNALTTVRGNRAVFNVRPSAPSLSLHGSSAKREYTVTMLVIITSSCAIISQLLYIALYALKALTAVPKPHNNIHWILTLHDINVRGMKVSSLLELMCRSSMFLCYVIFSPQFRRYVRQCLKRVSE